MAKSELFSLIVPAYSEEGRILDFLSRLEGADVLRNAELILAIDGKDGTERLAREFARKRKISLALSKSPSRRGKGGAILDATRLARNDKIVFCDCDPNLELGKIGEFVRSLNAAGIVIGRRIFAENRPLARRILTKLFNSLVRHILHVQFKDTQCGMKAFRKKDVGRIFGSFPGKGLGFDFDLVLIRGALDLGIGIREVAVREKYDGRTRFRIFPDAFSMLASLFEIGRLSRKGP